MSLLLDAPAPVAPLPADDMLPQTTVQVLVLDAHTLVAQGVAAVLTGRGYEAHPCAAQDCERVLALARELRPDVVLLDLALAGSGTDAPSLVTALRAHGAEVLILTGGTEPLALAEAVEAGAIGFVTKMAPVEELAEAVRRAARHESVLSAQERVALVHVLRQDRAETRARLAPFATLTPREAAVLERLMQGESAESVSAAAFVSLATVRSQIRAILTKLGVSSQLAAVAMAYRAGWSRGLSPSR